MRFSPLKSLRAGVLAVGLAAFAPLFAVAAPTSADTVSVVYVDVDKIVSDVDEGVNAQENMKKEQQKRQGEIQAMEAKIKKLQDELEKQSKSMSKDAIEKKAAEYQQALGDYQQIVLKFNNELSAKEREFFDPIERKLKDLLREVANRDGYDMILSKRSVPYGRKDLDLTDKVIQEYNKKYPAAKIAKPDDKKPATTTSSSAKKPAPAPAPSASIAPKMK
jgi:outer membrane protein